MPPLCLCLWWAWRSLVAQNGNMGHGGDHRLLRPRRSPSDERPRDYQELHGVCRVFRRGGTAVVRRRCDDHGAATANVDAMRTARLAHIARIVFGACAMVLKAARRSTEHLSDTAPMIPNWLPPNTGLLDLCHWCFPIPPRASSLITGHEAGGAWPRFWRLLMYTSCDPAGVRAGTHDRRAGCVSLDRIGDKLSFLIGVAWTIADFH